jgi:pyruvate,water dikinase
VGGLVEHLGTTAASEAEWDDLLGGKGSSLERLIRLGANTPPGFCVTTRAFHHQLASDSDSRDALAALPDEPARQGLLRALIEGPLAEPLGTELDLALTTLADGQGGGAVRLAVRSSAVGEDSQFASFAGIHETELDVAATEVPAAVRRCWASVWSERAVEYRSARGLPQDTAMAVVVQVLVPAEASAVVFTRHPVTGRDDQVVVNAISGLGEALVSGLVTPDELVLDKPTLRPVSVSTADGAAVLDDDQLHALGSLARDLEGIFGGPIDIEAALADGRWHVLQARPITA